MPIISHKFNSVQPGIFMDVVVSAPGSDEKWSVTALWDTGANVSVICESVAKNLGLEVKGAAELRYANGLGAIQGRRFQEPFRSRMSRRR